MEGKSAVAMTSLQLMRDRIDLFQCPLCEGTFSVEHEVVCNDCGGVYPTEADIPCLYVSDEDDVTRDKTTLAVRAFYEETPFPDYEDFESIEDLIRKAEQGLFARLLNDQIPHNGDVLEVGCGTGQLTNYLGVAHRTVFGADMTLNSLKLANDFKVKNALDRVGFCQMNLYRPVFREEGFDLVICNGVLCAAADPYGGFQSISKLVKKGGYILIGTYNKYGRLITDLRRVIIKTLGRRFAFLDPHLRSESVGDRKKKAWLEDQYNHPYESKHTMAQVQNWFETMGFDFMYGVPNPKAFQPFQERDAIFEPHPKGNWLDHLIVQSKLAFQGSYEGGFFTMIARRSS